MPCTSNMRNFGLFEVYCLLLHREPSFYDAPIASFNINNLSTLSVRYFSVSYGVSSQPISMELFHLLAGNIRGFRVPSGNLNVLRTSGTTCCCALGSVLLSAITLSVVQATVRATFHVKMDYFFQHDKDK